MARGRARALAAPPTSNAPSRRPAHCREPGLLLAVVLAVLGLPAPGTTDIPIFLRWVAAAAVSLRSSYAVFYQFGYPPLHFVLLRGAALLATAFSDLVSLGVVAYQMVTGRLPFEASSQEEISRASQPVPPAS